MAQESIDYFIQMAKDYAKAEKELEVQHWVFVNFERKDESNNYVHKELKRHVTLLSKKK